MGNYPPGLIKCPRLQIISAIAQASDTLQVRAKS